MARQLTEKQQKLLDVLFDEAGGDIRTAMDLAGYSENASVSSVSSSIKDEIIDKTKDWLSLQSPQAATKLVGIMRNPTELGNRELLASIKEVLDRVGIVKSEVLQVESKNGIMILPPKNMDSAKE